MWGSIKKELGNVTERQLLVERNMVSHYTYTKTRPVPASFVLQLRAEQRKHMRLLHSEYVVGLSLRKPR